MAPYKKSLREFIGEGLVKMQNKDNRIGYLGFFDPRCVVKTYLYGEDANRHMFFHKTHITRRGNTYITHDSPMRGAVECYIISDIISDGIRWKRVPTNWKKEINSILNNCDGRIK